MAERRALYRLVGAIGGIMVITALLIFCVDPFYHYHKAWFGLPLVMDQAVYQTAGAAKNLSYSSVILGTSMTENFHCSWFDEEMGWNTFKLSYSGARTDDLHAILEQVFAGNSIPENIIMDLNIYQLTEPYWTAYVERPKYLYDNNPFTDVNYLYNQDVLLVSLSRVADKIEGIEYDLDSAYTWEDESYFGREHALRSAEETRQKLLEGNMEYTELSWRMDNCLSNMNNIIPFIESHPETQFYIFYPPYSMLYWEQEILKGELEQIMAIYEYSVRLLLPYENVKLYYFQDEEEIISNLDNYRDTTHYCPDINRYIFECIRDDEKLLTEENYQERLYFVYEYARDFPYEMLWNQQ